MGALVFGGLGGCVVDMIDFFDEPSKDEPDPVALKKMGELIEKHTVWDGPGYWDDNGWRRDTRVDFDAVHREFSEWERQTGRVRRD